MTVEVAPEQTVEVDAILFKNTRLIMGAPNSLAFLDGLAIDLLIQTFKLKRKAILNSRFVEQIIGTKVYSHAAADNELYTAWEAYQGDELPGYTVIQFRSRALQGFGYDFAIELASWIEKQGFEEIYVLTGLDKRRRTDAQINSSPIRFLIQSSNPSTVAEVKGKAEAAGLKELEEIKDPHTLYRVTLPPGAGILQFLLNELKASKTSASLPPICVLSYFTETGDNNLAAHQLVDALDALLKLRKGRGEMKWLVPSSWRALYGAEMGEDVMKEIF